MDHLQQVEMACKAGVRWIQLRMKEATDAEVLSMALKVRAVTDEYGATLIINDRVGVAAEVGAGGVHVGKQDMPVSEARRLLGPGKIIGGTANTIEDIREHQRQGADYIGLGPYRYTTTKKNLSPILGLDGYRNILGQLDIDIPVFAIGGIGMEDVEDLFGVGLHGIVFSGMLVHAEDGREVIRELNKLF